MTLSLMVKGTIASQAWISNDTATMQNSAENSTQSNVTSSKNVESIKDTNQTGSIASRSSSLESPSVGGNCTVC
jgi:hypothetical protein